MDPLLIKVISAAIGLLVPIVSGFLAAVLLILRTLSSRFMITLDRVEVTMERIDKTAATAATEASQAVKAAAIAATTAATSESSQERRHRETREYVNVEAKETRGYVARELQRLADRFDKQGLLAPEQRQTVRAR